MINSPNNPTGAVYSAEELDGLGRVLEAASKKFDKRIYLISDEPYRKIAYDVEVPSVFDAYDHTIVLTSYSKELSLAGERIGYLAVHPKAEDARLVAAAAGVANTMMYVNAPALFQQVVGRLQGVAVDINIYRRRRDLFCQGLKKAGYEFDVPNGAFYLFPKSPIENDVEFVNLLKEQNILAVPGTGFGGPGHFRLSYAVPDDVIARSLPGFKKPWTTSGNDVSLSIKCQGAGSVTSPLTCSMMCQSILFTLPGLGKGFQIFEGRIDLFLGKIMIRQVSSEIGFIGSHVHQSVAGPVEQNHFFLAFFLGFQRLPNGHGHGMVAFRAEIYPSDRAKVMPALKVSSW